ncbi:MAG: type II toxin-antitoxin system VapC family toxin [Rubrobacteraceae bacterium]
MIVYLETSAMLKLYVEEEGRKLVREAVGSADLTATSTVAYAEARAGLARRWREGDFTHEEHRGAVEDLEDDWITYARLDTSNLVSNQAGELAEHHALRGFDSIHLASALRLLERFEDLQFLAFDNRLNDAARKVRLPVYGGEIN